MTSFDAFGRLRVSDPTTLFDYQAQYDAGPLFWENSETGTGSAAHDADRSCVTLSVSAANDKVIRQTRGYHRYQPGKSQLILTTFVMAPPQSGVVQKVGYFDGANGIFLKESNGSVSLVLRSSASGELVDTEVPKSEWNLDDGDSINLTKAQIFWIDLEWLGVGSVRCGFVGTNREFIACHEFRNANSVGNVYMTTANLPVRYEIEATSEPSTAAVMQAICATVISEGGFEAERGLPFSKSSSHTSLKALANDTRTPLVSIRPKATFNSVVNRGQIIPFDMTGVAQDKGALFELVYNGTLTNASFASVDSSSLAEGDVAATAISGGIVLQSFPVAAASQGSGQSPGSSALGILSRLPLTLDIAGSNPIPLTLCATRIGGADTANVAGTINWHEIR